MSENVKNVDNQSSLKVMKEKDMKSEVTTAKIMKVIDRKSVV